MEASEIRKMPLRVCLGALGLFLVCTVSLVGGEMGEISVDISWGGVTLRCPGENSQLKIKEGNSYIPSEGVISILEEFTEIEREVVCGKSRKMYLKIKGCSGCVELSLQLGAIIILSDLGITLGILLQVYFCCKKRPFCGAGRPKRAPPEQDQDLKADCPPPVPNPDYEPIRKGQREVYSGLEPRAF